MGKLPGYDSKVGMTTDVPVAKRSMSAEAQEGQNISNIGKAAEDIANVWQEAKDFTETLNSQKVLDEGQREIFNKAQNDPDYENSDIHQQDLNTLREQSLEGFSNNLARKKFSITANNQTAAASIKVDGLFRSKMIDHTKAGIIDSHNKNREAYIAGDLTAKDKQAQVVEEALKKGFVNERFAVNEAIKLQGWDSDRAIADAHNGNADEVAKHIKEGTEYDIPEGKKADILKEIRSIKTINANAIKKQLREDQVKGELGLLDEFRAKGLKGISADQVLEMVDKKIIRPKFGEALIKYMINPEVYKDAAWTDPNFDGYILAILDSKDKEMVNARLETALDKAEVAETDLAIMIGLAIKKSESLISLDQDSGEKPEVKKDHFLWLKNLIKGTDKKDTSTAIRNYESKTKNGSDPASAVNEIKKEINAKNYPKLKDIPKEGILLPDKYGNIRRVFPDGRDEPE